MCNNGVIDLLYRINLMLSSLEATVACKEGEFRRIGTETPRL